MRYPSFVFCFFLRVCEFGIVRFLNVGLCVLACSGACFRLLRFVVCLGGAVSGGTFLSN